MLLKIFKIPRLNQTPTIERYFCNTIPLLDYLFQIRKNTYL